MAQALLGRFERWEYWSKKPARGSKDAEAIPGIYALYSKDKLQYIGQSVNLLRRIREQKSKCIFEEARVLRIPERGVRIATEGILIFSLSPPFNQRVQAQKTIDGWKGESNR